MLERVSFFRHIWLPQETMIVAMRRRPSSWKNVVRRRRHGRQQQTSRFTAKGFGAPHTDHMPRRRSRQRLHPPTDRPQRWEGRKHPCHCCMQESNAHRTIFRHCLSGYAPSFLIRNLFRRTEVQNVSKIFTTVHSTFHLIVLFYRRGHQRQKHSSWFPVARRRRKKHRGSDRL